MHIQKLSLLLKFCNTFISREFQFPTENFISIKQANVKVAGNITFKMYHANKIICPVCIYEIQSIEIEKMINFDYYF